MPSTAGVAYRVHHGGDSQAESPPLVLIHGAGGSSLHWPPQLRRLPGYNVYALDLPGHGESPGPSPETIPEKAAQVISWKEALGLEACVFAGHSMGGAITLTLALDHPQHVSGIILVGTGGRLRVHPDILALTALEESYPEAVEMIGRWAFSQSAEEQLVLLAGKRMLETPSTTVHADFVACNSFDVLDRLNEIACPVHVICGSKDLMTPPKFSRFLLDQLASAELSLIEDAGHMVMLEQPERVSRTVQAFLQKTFNNSG
jgi:pimeloyl-ACP methyl ester carboxylesterase